MQHYNDSILYQVHQHVFVLVVKIIRIFIPYTVVISFLGYIFSWHILLILAICIISGAIITLWYCFFWLKSYFCISNEKIIVKVRNGIFSKFHMSISFANIRDIAFSKNNIFHYIFDYGIFFARSSAGANGDLQAQYIPHIEKVYKIINALHSMDAHKRKHITHLDQISNSGNTSHIDTSVNQNQNKQDTNMAHSDNESLEQAIEKERNILLQIPGIKEVVLLDGKDRRYIFENEEDRNHGVYECLRRQVLFAATHDHTLRNPDESIVMKAGEKVIFPVVEFHEIKRKKVSSSSPSLRIHTYLVGKFQNFDTDDATLLIGFDT